MPKAIPNVDMSSEPPAATSIAADTACILPERDSTELSSRHAAGGFGDLRLPLSDETTGSNTKETNKWKNQRMAAKPQAGRADGRRHHQQKPPSTRMVA